MEWLNGADFFNQKLGEVIPGARFTKNFPPVSKDAGKGINNLLDANIIEKYFEQYNKGKELKNSDGDVIQRSVVEGRSLKVNSGIMKDGGISHDALIKKACDG